MVLESKIKGPVSSKGLLLHHNTAEGKTEGERVFVKGGQTHNDSCDNEPTPSTVVLIHPLCSNGLITS